jgi:hypothetical protein
VVQMVQKFMIEFLPRYMCIAMGFVRCHYLVYSVKFPQSAYFGPHIALKKHETINYVLVFNGGSTKLI